MAKDISHSGPGDPGSMQGQIKSPMCSTNVDNKGGGETHSYKGTFHDGSGGGKGDLKTDDKIYGPGNKGALPHKGK